MHWVYLSPHFDDIALSCGGLVWEQANSGESASVWTICAADPPPGSLSAFAQSLHARWGSAGNAVAERREEDRASCQAMGAATRHFDLPDCIYRPGGESGVFYYASEEAIFGPLHPQEEALALRLAGQFGDALLPPAALVSPLTLGGHVDHRLTRRAAEATGLPLWYYADYPYVLSHANALSALEQAGWESKVFPVSEKGLSAWQEAVALHRSQISTFWNNLEEMREAIQDYWSAAGGVRLWRQEGS